MGNKFVKPTVERIVKINFIHPKHGNTWFKYQINSLNNNVMFWFGYTNSMFVGLADVKKIASTIKTDKKFTFVSQELVNF